VRCVGGMNGRLVRELKAAMGERAAVRRRTASGMRPPEGAKSTGLGWAASQSKAAHRLAAPPVRRVSKRAARVARSCARGRSEVFG